LEKVNLEKKVTSNIFQFCNSQICSTRDEPLSFLITFSATHLVKTGVASTLCT